MIDEIIERMESLRIDVDAEIRGCWIPDAHRLRLVCERANEMLDDCIAIVRDAVKEATKNESGDPA